MQSHAASLATRWPWRKTRSYTKKVSAKSKKVLAQPPKEPSVGTLREKAFRKGKVCRSVISRLSSVCHDPLLVSEVQRSASDMKQIQLEAWHLVNLHTLRCLHNNLPLPDYANKTNTFFNRCCSGVATTARTHYIARDDPELWETIKIYQSHRAECGLNQVEDRTGYMRLKHEMARQMRVNAVVMIKEHFYKRLRLYLRITYGALETDLTTAQRKVKNKLVADILRSCYHVEETNMREARQIRDMLTPDGVEWGEQWIPWPNHIEENGVDLYVRLIWRFQSVVEQRMEAVPDEKGVRAFSIFPISTTYTKAYIIINASTLVGFYQRIQERVPWYRWNFPGVSLQERSFSAHRWEVMRHAFNISRFETRHAGCHLTKPAFTALPVEEKYAHASHLFANQVTTDGYGASILFFRPKNEDDTKSNKKGPVATVFPPGYQPDVVIGLDPGMRALCTAVREVLRPPPPRRRRRQRRQRQRGRRRRKRRKGDHPRWIRRFKPPRHKNHRDIVQVLTREYRHLAGFRRFRAWNEGQRALHPQYQAVIANMPSFKTARYIDYLLRLDFFWLHARYLLQFAEDRPFLKWKFFRARMKRAAVDAVARRVVPTVSRSTCVGYGDWSRRDGIRGHASGPVKGLKQALRKRAVVVSVDEFRTSKLCSQCYHPLSTVSYVVETELEKKKKHKGKVLPRNHAQTVFEEKDCYGVLRCDHKECDAHYWDRDVNAAINMLELLKRELRGLGRMPAFRRARPA